MKALTVLASLVLFAGGCSAGPLGGGSAGDADYPSYATADALFEGATLVVEASVAVPPRTRDIDIGGGSVERYLVADAVVSRVLKGDAAVGSTVQVKQDTQAGPDGRHLAAGKSYLLFLETYEDVPASTLNPAQGQYELDDAGLPVPLPGNEVRISPADLERLAGE